ncbi:hypothetical protein FRZ67_16095 [Panacibacter ginsenosidivorans]|uniref:Uncharacterized protein n=1 Tax=Panacibacter ginsenosidivorans TaxID=1813871 RepID=A0A5B8VB90_9BACT|nr:hypothetical protein [Panacibacter ginsenosidivorans]QEC68750.1 hypothetical protein FRZ67_16095 [Panacibacter ginsenosidivorans]
MKKTAAIAFSLFTFILIAESCKKDASLPSTSYTEKTIKFLLHTEQDYSSDNDSITFSAFIKSHTAVLFDSVLYSMKIKDIPGLSNQLAFEKKITTNDNDDLSVGFRYEIKSVGISWYRDTCQAGLPYKVVDFSFR